MRKLSVTVSPLFVVLLVVFVCIGEGIPIAVYTVSLAVHECAHALVAAHYGYRLDRMRLAPYGAVLGGEQSNMTPREEWRIALAGPLASLMLACVCAAGAGVLPCRPFWSPLVEANLSIGICNLVPCYPLDGGRILRAVLAGRMHAVRATRIVSAVGIATGCVLAVLACVGALQTQRMTFAIVAVFCVTSAITSGKGARYTAAMDTLALDRALGHGLRLVPYAVRADVPLARVLSLCDGKKYCVFAVCNERAQWIGLVDEQTVRCTALTKGAACPIGALVSESGTALLQKTEKSAQNEK